MLERAYTEHLGTFRCTYPGAKGTDLGISFVQDGRVVFLFGDTMADGPRLQDVNLAATAPLVLDRAVPPELAWLGPLAPPGLPLGRMGVPTDGVAIDGDTYVFFATRFDERTQIYGTSALARTRGLALDRLELAHEAPAGDFANVSVVVVDDEAFVFGTGAYRRSAIRLARVPLARLADRAAWAIAPDPVVDVACAGELSVRKHPRLPLYLLAYNASEPRGIALWLADHPAGPWRSAGLLYAPSDGYERFIHAKESAVGHDDGLSQPATRRRGAASTAPTSCRRGSRKTATRSASSSPSRRGTPTRCTSSARGSSLRASRAPAPSAVPASLLRSSRATARSPSPRRRARSHSPSRRVASAGKPRSRSSAEATSSAPRAPTAGALASSAGTSRPIAARPCAWTSEPRPSRG